MYIDKNIIYPSIAVKNNIEGRVTLRLVVEKDGTISDNVTVLRGVDPSLDAEAIRVVKSMPKWIPGKQNGKAVCIYYTLPVHFILND